ncbi:hypothetical protein J6590_000655 [Homalodisca vitripennis]|nr:hypothetical protein J6590_000655 [Homalodisca vitripennis]
MFIFQQAILLLGLITVASCLPIFKYQGRQETEEEVPSAEQPTGMWAMLSNLATMVLEPLITSISTSITTAISLLFPTEVGKVTPHIACSSISVIFVLTGRPSGYLGDTT